MKFICSKQSLLNGLQIVSKAVPNKTTMSILECILVEAKEGTIKFTANDMELGIETVIEGNILEKGTIALDARIFLDIVRKLPDNDVTIKQTTALRPLLPVKKLNLRLLPNPERISPIFLPLRRTTVW